jgi:hypothetical protein
MESGTNLIPNNCGRVGAWFDYNDGTGTQVPPASSPDGGVNSFVPSVIPNGGRGASHYAAHTDGSGFSSYAGMGVTLGGLPNGMNPPYDAAAHGYTGIQFYAMLGSTPGAQPRIEIMAVDKYSTPAAGLCDPNVQSGPTQCYDNPRTTLTLSPTWTLVTIPFGMLVRGGWGYGGTAPLDPTTLYTIAFEDNNTETGNSAPLTVDIWISDISFTEAGPDASVEGGAVDAQGD